MTKDDGGEQDSWQHAGLVGRVGKYKEVIERVVQEIGEHPLYELKSSCSLKDLAERIEFVKDIQSIATSRIETEKYLVIGADATSKKFVAVGNLEEFDETNIRQILGKYLNPIPELEVLQLQSSDQSAFVLIVIPRQKIRRILAKCTVTGGDASNTKVLLREGDLWTKGGSTGKRLATPEDWDEIYEEKIEREVENRTKIRTAHLLEQAIAQERIRSGYGLTGLPTYATDEESLVLIEQLCATKDVDRFKLLLERLRDEVVEAWHEIKAYDDMPQEYLQSPEDSIPEWMEVVKNHKQNVFLPAMQRLTMTGILVVKNAGPTGFLDLIVNLLREVYEISHRLRAMQTLWDVSIRLQKRQSSVFNEHTSDTLPALESLVSLHIIGAYICKRNRYEYISLLFRPDVVTKRPYLDKGRKSVMAFWPLVRGCGEPQELGRRAGRINLCVGRILAEHAYSRTFGSETVALESLIQYEFLLKLNSYLAIHSQQAPRPMDFMAHRYEGILFEFWDSLIAFNLEPIWNLAVMLYKEIKEKKSDLLKQVLFDPELAVFLTREDANQVFKHFLQRLCKDQSALFLEQNRFPPEVYWPEELKTLLN